MNAVARCATTGILTVIALASVSSSTKRQILVSLVIQDHAQVSRHVLGHALEAVVDVYRSLGIDITWSGQAFARSDTVTMHFRILPGTGASNAGRILGIDAPAVANARTHVAHILYGYIDDDAVTGRVLGYVMARLIGGALDSHGQAARPLIMHADRRTAARWAQGIPVFTHMEAAAIRRAAAALAP